MLDQYTLCVIALSVVVVLLAVWRMRGKPQHHFVVSPEAQRVYAQSKKYFDTEQQVTFKGFASAVPQADAVLYADLHAAHRTETLSPEIVQRVLTDAA